MGVGDWRLGVGVEDATWRLGAYDISIYGTNFNSVPFPSDTPLFEQEGHKAYTNRDAAYVLYTTIHF